MYIVYCHPSCYLVHSLGNLLPCRPNRRVGLTQPVSYVKETHFLVGQTVLLRDSACSGVAYTQPNSDILCTLLYELTFPSNPPHSRPSKEVRRDRIPDHVLISDAKKKA